MSKHKHTPECCIEDYRMLIEYLWKNTNQDAKQFIVKLANDVETIHTKLRKNITCKNPSHIIQSHHSPC